MEWRKTFLYNKFKNFDKEIDTEYYKILAQNDVKSLFKYRSGEEYDIDNLKNNYLRSVVPDKFNDPFEFKYRSIDLENDFRVGDIVPENKLDRIIKQIKQELNYDQFKTWDNAVNYSINQLNVSCLSEINDSILMWSHYANSHQGFCIEYDTMELLDKYYMICPVIYSNQMPKFILGKASSLEIIKILLTKSMHWGYEKEWRIVTDSKMPESFISVPKPKAIYLGCKSNQRLEEILYKYCKENNIPLFKGKCNNSNYKIDFKIIKERS